MSSSRIHFLSPHVISQIAAGEVIYRPCHIIKELVENSLDAQSTQIDIHLKDAGKSLIQIADNGRGMSPEDLAICPKRHSTSKLKTIEDFLHLNTFGFRGEALASIAAVSDLTCISREKSSADTYAVSLSPEDLLSDYVPKKITFGDFISNSPPDKKHGTFIQIQRLFAGLPVRLKFLKRQSIELKYIQSEIDACALSYPFVGFRLWNNNQLLCNYLSREKKIAPDDHRIFLSRIREIFHCDLQEPILFDEDSTGAHRKLKIYWLSGWRSAHQKNIFSFVNYRFVKNKELEKIILKGLHEVLLPGFFPAIIFYLTLPPQEVDINIHPSKTEIRFLQEEEILTWIYSVIKKMIQTQGAFGTAFLKENTKEKQSAWKIADSSSSSPLKKFSDPTQELLLPSSFQNSSAFFLNQQKEFFFLKDKRYEFIGILFQTYLLIEQEKYFFLIDQHAADERIRYEKISHSHQRSHERQMLLFGEKIALPHPESPEKIAEIQDLLQKKGFETLCCDNKELIFHSIPGSWTNDHLTIRLLQMVHSLVSDDVSSLSEIAYDDFFKEKTAEKACHTSLRSGDSLTPLEGISLIEQLFQCEHPWNCPHGRPVIIKIPRQKIDQWFQRIPTSLSSS